MGEGPYSARKLLDRGIRFHGWLAPAIASDKRSDCSATRAPGTGCKLLSALSIFLWLHGAECMHIRKPVYFNNMTGIAVFATASDQIYKHPVLQPNTTMDMIIIMSCYNSKHVSIFLQFGRDFRVHIAVAVLVTGQSSSIMSDISDMQPSAVHIRITVSIDATCVVEYKSPLRSSMDTLGTGIPCRPLDSFLLRGDHAIVHKTLLSSTGENGMAVWDFSTISDMNAQCATCPKNQKIQPASTHQSGVSTCVPCYTGIAVNVNRTSQWWTRDLPKPEWALLDSPRTQDDQTKGVLRYSNRLENMGFFDLTSTSVQYLDDAILTLCERNASSLGITQSSTVLHFGQVKSSSTHGLPWSVGDRMLIQQNTDAVSSVNPNVMFCMKSGDNTCLAYSPKNFKIVDTHYYAHFATQSKGLQAET